MNVNIVDLIEGVSTGTGVVRGQDDLVDIHRQLAAAGKQNQTYADAARVIYSLWSVLESFPEADPATVDQVFVSVVDGLRLGPEVNILRRFKLANCWIDQLWMDRKSDVKTRRPAGVFAVTVRRIGWRRRVRLVTWKARGSPLVPIS
jgi:hypothetical protein